MVETILVLNRFVLPKPAHIVALVRNANHARERFVAYRDRADLAVIEQDISDELSFQGRADYIIHAASQARLSDYVSDPVGTLSANVFGTQHVLNAARRYAARGILFFSSGAVYGNVEHRSAPIAEHDMGFLDPAGERACYDESKRMGETMCVAWTRQFGIPTRVVRPWHTYGPGMRLNDGRVFADFVRDILAGGPIVLRSDGAGRRCFCYLADATLGFFTVLLKGGDGEAYNVANPRGETGIGELADRLARVYRDDGVTVELASPQDDTAVSSTLRVLPDISKIESLGWAPKWSIEDGFQRTVESYRPERGSRTSSS
jgi:UDP-glucuronate decarboxylase